MKSVFAALALASVFCVGSARAEKIYQAEELCLRFEGRADPDAFIAACTRVIKANAWDTEARGTALANRALMYVQMKQYDLALADCEVARRLTFDHVQFAYQACGLVHAAQGDDQAAISAFDKAVRQGEAGWIDPYLGRASVYLKLQNYGAAIADCNVAIKHKADAEMAFALRGRVYLEQKQYANAVADFDTALKLAPNSPKAASGRAEAKRALEAEKQPPQMAESSLVSDDLLQQCTRTPGSKGTNQGRIDSCTKIIESAATPVRARITALKARGYLHGIEGQMGQLLSDYDDASAENPDNPFRWLEFGDRHRDAGQIDRAIADYGEAIRLNPKFAEAFQHRCMARADHGEPDDTVLADCDRAVLLRPKDPQMPRTRAHVSIDLGLYAKAIAELDAQRALHPDDMSLPLYRCRAGAFWGKDLESAQADCDKLAAPPLNFVEAMISRAVIFYRRGDFAVARFEATRALAINAKMPEALYIRALAKRRLDAPDADTDFAAAKALYPLIAERFARHGLTP